MNPLFLIPVVLAIAGVFFMIYMNKKRKYKKQVVFQHAQKEKDTPSGCVLFLTKYKPV